MSEEHAGVRVMTVHAAKGLEFETVAVADLGRPLCVGGQPPELRLDFEVEAAVAAAGEGPPPARVGLRLARAGATSIDTEGYSELNDDAADAEAEESGRLVYVAASRAQRRLILSGTFADKDLEASEKPRRSAQRPRLPAPGARRRGADGEIGDDPRPGAAGGPRRGVRRCRGRRPRHRRRRRDRQPPVARPPRRCGLSARARERPAPADRAHRAAAPRPPAASPTPRSPTTGGAATGSWSSG